MTTFWIILGGVGAAAALLGIGIGLGRWSRRDDIEELEDRLGHAERSVERHIAYEDNVDAAYREIRDILGREQAKLAELRAKLAERSWPEAPLWSQLGVVEPPRIDKSWLAWDGSAAGHTGAWSTVAPFTVVDLGADELVAA